jgi:predicted nuclease of restriction endonuclease-like (RecB) superfamily
MPNSRRMDEQIVVHFYNETLLSNKKEWMTDIPKNMDESQKHCSEKKKGPAQKRI